ncbi:response regulator [Candidatus Poribacteria bacterium]|nr:response regulator [Candidatus Poribacteria bacterium]
MILIVDDQENMCWILSKILSKEGFSVKTAHTAKEAFSIADTSEISAAVLDFRLPDGNGLDLFLELKKRHGNLVGVLITSYGSKKLREEASALGFITYFDKPFDNHALVAALKGALEKEFKEC